MYKYMIGFFKHHPFWVVSVIFLFFTFFGFTLWSEFLPVSVHARLVTAVSHIGIDEEHLNDFGLNFTSEMMGGFIASVVIGYYFVWRDKKKNLPMQLAQHRELTSFLLPLVNVWQQAYRQTGQGEKVGYKELFSEKSFATIIEQLDMTAVYDPDEESRYIKDGVEPPTWLEELVRVNERCAGLCSDILKTYNSNLDPKLFGRLQELLRETGFLTLIQDNDRKYRHQAREQLYNYFYGDDKALRNLVWICDWANEKQEAVTRKDPEINLVRIG